MVESRRRRLPVEERGTVEEMPQMRGQLAQTMTGLLMSATLDPIDALRYE